MSACVFLLFCFAMLGVRRWGWSKVNDDDGGARHTRMLSRGSLHRYLPSCESIRSAWSLLHLRVAVVSYAHTYCITTIEHHVNLCAAHQPLRNHDYLTPAFAHRHRQ